MSAVSVISLTKRQCEGPKNLSMLKVVCKCMRVTYMLYCNGQVQSVMT